ncbi:sulfurtransferase [Streptomyces sp. NBC_01089]|uniref:sulfurtransferase n=1 Tax=Streptomyces sp. NBC_01089 TaxID=2903747 RepID=UPI00386E72AC|nr:sulfurtransferase [Streptomyces sp. NBC_01089]
MSTVNASSEQALPPACGVPGPLVGVDWLAARLGGPGLVVLDASVGAHRGIAPGTSRVREDWTGIPGARCFDIDGALSDRTSPLPHTMPGAGRFTDELRALGVNDTDTVVVYDAVGIHSSARAWWMLRAMGFERAAVLDGGLPAWTAAGLPVEREGPGPAARPGEFTAPPGDFTARPRTGLVVGSAEVTAALAGPEVAVLDARARARFSGEAAEPRPGLRGGHMPGAANLPFTEIQQSGRMSPAAELRTAFSRAAGGRERLVFSCGSGVTACVLALGAELAGYRDLSVYDGSWSEWGLPSDRPVETGDGRG